MQRFLIAVVATLLVAAQTVSGDTLKKTEFCSSLAAAPDAAAEQRLIDDFLDTRGPGDELSFTVRDAAGRPLQLGDFSVADYAALDVLLECGGEPVRWKPKSEAAFTFLFRE